MRAAIVLSLAASGCMPPSVKAVDDWLTAYASGDVERAVAHTWSGDRELVRAALVEQASDPNGATALLLPPKPISHEILEIHSKESDERHVVLAKITMKNPLPFASERTGNALPDIPRTRTEERRFLSVREGERWGVKLDLTAVKARAEFATRFLDLVGARDFEAARSVLENVPPPPDDPNAQKTKDRMIEELKKELAKRQSVTSSTAVPKK